MIKTDTPAVRPARTTSGDYIPRTYFVRKVVEAKIRYIADKEGLTIIDTVDALLSAAIDDYEMEHGELQEPTKRETQRAQFNYRAAGGSIQPRTFPALYVEAKTRRRANDWLAELAEVTGRSSKTVMAWAYRWQRPSKEIRERLAAYMSIPADELFPNLDKNSDIQKV